MHLVRVACLRTRQRFILLFLTLDFLELFKAVDVHRHFFFLQLSVLVTYTDPYAFCVYEITVLIYLCW